MEFLLLKYYRRDKTNKEEVFNKIEQLYDSLNELLGCKNFEIQKEITLTVDEVKWITVILTCEMRRKCSADVNKCIHAHSVPQKRAKINEYNGMQHYRV